MNVPSRSKVVRNLCGFFLSVSLVLLGLPQGALAQSGKITGVVTDAQTGEPLAGAQVYLEDVGVGTLTADNGRYFMINVRPGVYTVAVELLGYQTVRRQGVLVAIDVTRTVNFELTPQAIAIEEIRVEAERVPLIDVTSTGTSDVLQPADIVDIPVTNLQEVLRLRQGFLVVPQNTDLLTFQDTRRALTPLRIRGGRAGETLTLIDGIPINNFVFGGPSFDITNTAYAQIDFLRGGYEPQYGNALSGIINIATREGGTDLEGAIEYQTSELAGALGNDPDDLMGYDLWQGFLSGPVPGTQDKLRFMVAGRQQNGADRVLEFDDLVFDPQNPDFGFRAATPFDVFPGWRAFGYDAERDLFGKATFYFTPAAKLNFTIIDYERENLAFDFEFLGTYDNQLDSPTIDTPEDSAAILGNRFNDRLFPVDFPGIVQSSARLTRNLYVGNWDHTIQNLFYRLTVGFFEQKRLTCNYFEGVCLEDRFEDPNFTDDRFIGPVPGGRRFPARHPTTGTDNFFGGEKLETWVGRGDVQLQATDHHNVQAGVFHQRHDLFYDETENLGANLVTAKIQRYRVKPNDLAFYVQDRIEYDFLTVKLGFRVDRTSAPGTFFANPLDPTNGTTAATVCSNPGNWQNVTVRVPVEVVGQAVTFETQTLSADPAWANLGPNCGGDPDVLDEAARIAFSDDFVEAEARWQFSPRIHVNFPVTARSSLFFNFGRYSQNALLRNLYNFTGVGTPHEGVPLGFFQDAGGQVADFFGPFVFDPREIANTRLVGNPNLDIEKTTLYEVGFSAELGENFGLWAVLFNKDQTGLTGVRTGGTLPGNIQVFDPGATYGTATPNFPVLVNQDFQTVRGFEIGLRRRLSDFWGFDLNYGFSEARTNAAEPERETQNRFLEFDPRIIREIPSEIDQPHRFNGVLRFAAGEEAPEIPGGELLKHSSLSFVVRAASGFPYTPTTTFAGTGTAGNLDRNSGRAPATWQIDLWGSKDFQLANVRYGVFLRVVNLLDRKNCIQVFTSTGDCEGGSPDQSRAREGNTFSALTDITSTFLDRPHYFGPRRSFNVGVRASF